MSVRRSVTFVIPGKPQPKGSTKSFIKNGRVVTTSDNDALKPWQAVATLVARANHSGWGIPFNGNVDIKARFAFPYLKAHLDSKGKVKESAPELKNTKPDLDKLQRALGDALKDAGVYTEDSRVVHWDATKVYDRVGSTTVVIRELN